MSIEMLTRMAMTLLAVEVSMEIWTASLLLQKQRMSSRVLFDRSIA
jgi:hypothetical protein